MKKILFICPHPVGVAPSQRFRFEQYIYQLEERGFEIVIEPFFTANRYSVFSQNGNLLPKIHAICISYLARLLLLSKIPYFHLIFIHREAIPIGPPVVEYIIAKVLRKKIVFDFDDAIWITDNTHESRLTRLLRWRKKVSRICEWSHRVSAGNLYLAKYALQFNINVTINPTTVDTKQLHVPLSQSRKSTDNITIGWTGSHSTLKYLAPIVPVLQSLQKKYPTVQFLVVADSDPKLPLSNYQYVPWQIETEVDDLSRIDIGIMPLPDDSWTRGKCGFKALQYMALGIPAVASPVGANIEILQHGVEGYLCTTPDEWFTSLEYLILNPWKRIEMGTAGRRKVVQHYSVSANSANFLSLFQ